MSLAEAIPQTDTPSQQAAGEYGVVFGRYSSLVGDLLPSKQVWI